MAQYDRIAKLFVDSERATHLAEAEAQLASTRAQLLVGAPAAESETLQITTLIAAETAHRAFPGGVTAALAEDGPGRTAWTKDKQLSESLEAIGVELVGSPASDLPSIGIGRMPPSWQALPTVTSVPRGWAGGAVPGSGTELAWRPGPLGAVLAGSFGAAELFAAVHQINPRAARRPAGISCWAPWLPWTTENAVGPQLEHLPSRLWLLGLGHLGQAYAWLLRALPYAAPERVLIGLQDTDQAASENIATQLLTTDADIGLLKTRIVSRALEAAAFRTVLVERRFDEHQRRGPSEPGAVLVGVDNHAARRCLSSGGWAPVIDVGLGAYADDFTQVLLHRVDDNAGELFREVSSDDRTRRRSQLAHLPAYKNIADADPCGAVVAAGHAVGTSFVGAVAAAMAFGELLRPAHDGNACTTWQANLRAPAEGAAVPRAPVLRDRVRATTEPRLLREPDGHAAPGSR